MSQVNMAQAMASPAYAKQLLINYYKMGNTMGVTSEQVGELEYVYSDRLANWLNSTATDDNQWVIDDDDWDDALEDGNKRGQNLTGYEDSTGDAIGHQSHVAGTFVVGAAGGLYNATQIGEAYSNVAGLLKGEAYYGTTVKYVPRPSGGDNTLDLIKGIKNGDGLKLDQVGSNGSSISDINSSTQSEHLMKVEETKKPDTFAWISAGLAIANAAAYMIWKPNKEQVNATEEIKKEIPNLQQELYTTQDNLAGINDELSVLTDDACAHTDDANTAMFEDKGEYDFYARILEYLEEAKTSGHEFTEDEAKMYEECIKYMTENSENVAMTQDDAEAAVNEIHDDMEGYQSDLDGQAENIANVTGVTDYAEGFDNATKTGCYIAGVGQALNAVSGVTAGAKLIGYGWIGWAVGIASIAAGGVSAYGSLEQFSWAGKVDEEIQGRKSTQDLEDNSEAIYNNTTDNFALDLENVEGLELEVPDDIEAPTGETPTVGPQNPNNPEEDEDERN